MRVQKAGTVPEKLDNTAATWVPSSKDLSNEAPTVGVLSRRKELGVEVSGLQELITYGYARVRGTCLYLSYVCITA